MKKPKPFDLGKKLKEIANRELAKHDSDAFCYAYENLFSLQQFDEKKISHTDTNGHFSFFYDNRLLFERIQDNLVYTYIFPF